MWFEDTVFYQLYPLTLCGAPEKNTPAGDAPHGAPASSGGTASEGSQPSSAQASSGGAASEGGQHRIGRLRKWAPYLKELGFGAVYLNPVFESDSHGYDTRDYRCIDRRLGTNAEFKDIVRVFHENGVKVVLDGVFNHVGRGFFAFRDVQEKKWDSPYRNWFRIDFNGDSPFHDGFWYEGWEGHYELVKLNLEDSGVQNYLMESIDFWFKEFDADGIRLDVAYLLPLWFIAMVKDRIRGLKPDAFLLGEILGDNARRFYDQGHVDAITDYPLYKGLWSALNSYNLFELAHTLKRSYGEMYRGLRLFSFADNHDVERLATKLTDPRDLPIAYALLLTLPGIPCIYYGSEWGAQGRKERGSDASLRPAYEAPMPNELTETIRKIIALRNRTPALQGGSYKELCLMNRAFAFVRESGGQQVLTAVNIDVEPVTLRIPGTGEVTLGPKEVRIRTGNEELVVK